MRSLSSTSFVSANGKKLHIIHPHHCDRTEAQFMKTEGQMHFVRSLPLVQFWNYRPLHLSDQDFIDRIFQEPSWWIPDECANALLPTIALLGCTGIRMVSLYQPADGIQLISHNAGIEIQFDAGDDHHHFFKWSVTGTFSQTVDSTFNLAGTIDHRQ